MSDSLQPRIHSWESDIKGHKLQFVLSISSLAIRSLLSRDGVCEVAGFGGAAPCEINLLCQEFSKTFQDKPPRASLLERKPRSLQERIPRRARASLKGVGGGASP